MNHKMFRRWSILFSGAMKLVERDVVLPLGTVKLPVIVAPGLYQMPVIASYYFPDGFMCCADKTDFIRLDINPEWVTTGGGSKWHQVASSSADIYTDVKHAYFRWYGNKAVKRPYRHTVTTGLSTA